MKHLWRSSITAVYVSKHRHKDEAAATFPASSPPHHLPGYFPPSLSWVRWSNNSCLSCRWRICTKKTTLKGLFMLFPWSASVREHNGLVLSCQAQGTLLEWPAGTSNELTALMFWKKMHNSWLTSTFFSVTRVFQWLFLYLQWSITLQNAKVLDDHTGTVFSGI